MLSANTNDSLQKLAKEIAPALSAHSDGILMNADLFQRIKAVYHEKKKGKLNTEQNTLLKKTYKKFVRGGALLSEADKEKLKKINSELSVLPLRFGDNVLADNNAFELVVTNNKDLAGLPESVIQAAAQTATERGKKNAWIFTLNKPSLIPFLQYDSNRALRRKMFEGYSRRGDNNNKNDNKKIVKQMVNLRLQKANMLGYKTAAGYILEESMAKTPEKVFALLDKIPVYQKDVEAYELHESDGKLLGILYMDFFPRPSKQGGAWMTAYRKQYRKNGKNVIPIISITTNFTKLTGDEPALLSFEEVTTLFHESGHSMHGLLSNCEYKSLSGTSVPRDFVEMPSQVMENWPAEPEVLKDFAFHYKTGKPIPIALIQKMEAGKHFNQGFALTEYFAASYLDMDWHTITKPFEGKISDFEKQAMDKIGLIPEIIPRYRSTYFSHIFSGGYAAGYYSYVWAEILDADVFQAFKETSLFDKTNATRFRNDILSKGGTEDAMKLFVNFRGREPKPDAYLKRKGLEK